MIQFKQIVFPGACKDKEMRRKKLNRKIYIEYVKQNIGKSAKKNKNK